MKERLLFLLKVILSLLLVFVVCKLVFILVNAGEDRPSMTDIIDAQPAEGIFRTYLHSACRGYDSRHGVVSFLGH